MGVIMAVRQSHGISALRKIRLTSSVKGPHGSSASSLTILGWILSGPGDVVIFSSFKHFIIPEFSLCKRLVIGNSRPNWTRLGGTSHVLVKVFT